MADQKSKTGFMPRRVSLNWAPSSYSLKVLAKSSKLELDKIWEAKEREEQEKLTAAPANSSDIPHGKQAA